MLRSNAEYGQLPKFVLRDVDNVDIEKYAHRGLSILFRHWSKRNTENSL